MSYKIFVGTKDIPLGSLILVEWIRAEKKVETEIVWSDNNFLKLVKDDVILAKTENEVARLFARTIDEKLYGGNAVLEKTEVDSWLSFSIARLSNSDLVDHAALELLNSALALKTWLAAKRLTIADICIFSALYSKQASLSPEKYTNICRWFKQMSALDVVKQVMSMPNVKKVFPNKIENGKAKNEEKKSNKKKDEGKFVELPGAEMGKVVVRFPPEASGYLHIGHAKAALLNQYYAQAFQGCLIMRFDDTNPAKEDVEFEQAILQDLEMLQIKPDRFTHSSDYFDLMLEYCEKLIKDGKAYVDDTPAEAMKEQREQKLPSANRDSPVEKNLKLWEEMQKGSSRGQECCVRAKIDFESPNGCLRDPTIYRCKPEPHPRTGTKYKVYPTYDFACPIVDAVEGVTHTLRTTEYKDRDPQFYWFIEALGLNRPHIYAYSRLNMTNTVLSKRKLTWLVAEGLVDGWDDPRFPTVRGILRRGMTVEGLRQFIIAQGSSKSVVFMEWDKIWAFNKKVIDPVAMRYTALNLDMVPVFVEGATNGSLTAQNHPKDPSIGTKTVKIGPKLVIEREDAEELKENENATFINWGNILINKINRENGKIVSVSGRLNLENKDFKNTTKLTWLCASEEESKTQEHVPCCLVFFDHIISKPVLGKDEDFKNFVAKDTRKEQMALGEMEMSRVKRGEIIQLQRKGFFKCDVPFSPRSSFSMKEQPLVLFHIPDGHAVTSQKSGVVNGSSGTASKKSAKSDSKGNDDAAKQYEKIAEQGEKVRKLKSEKAAKAVIEQEVKILLALKAEYKNMTGEDYKPGQPAPVTKTIESLDNSSKGSEIYEKITEQGEKVRKLKSEKAGKPVIDQEVKVLLALKADYKTVTGEDYKPGQAAPKLVAVVEKKIVHLDNSSKGSEIYEQISEQGEKVRKLKSEKAGKPVIDQEVKILLALKADYKNVTGEDYKPGQAAPKPAAAVEKKIENLDNSSKAEELAKKISEQGDKVRDLKSKKAGKSLIDEQVKILLELKTQYKAETGTEYKPATVSSNSGSSKKSKGTCSPAENIPVNESVSKKKQPVKTKEKVEKGKTRLGLEAKKSENFSEWYSQVITKGEMIEYYDVSGCYTLRPASYTIWEKIRDFFDAKIKKLGVQNCYFPIFVSRGALEREKDHIADFAPEVAWVTKSGESDLAEPIAIRPTSETIMYSAYAKWLHSYRDLPLKLNQWNNVVRWEFKNPQPFLRTREFLWQEGHTAFETKAEAEEEVLTILEYYAQIYEDLLAVPVIKGRKTEKEKFAGGDYTTTVEAFIAATGRGIQGGTSHHLGQNFSKMFEIQVESADESKERLFVYQNSWGFTTRSIGVMVMVHSDDQGLVVPPRVAPIQVVIVPCGITASTTQEERQRLLSECAKLEKELTSEGELRVKGDYRDNYSPGWKFNHWELKGVPLRLELGPKDLEEEGITLIRRDNGEKICTRRNNAFSYICQLLETIQKSMFQKAKKEMDQHVIQTNDWNEFCSFLDKKNMILAPFCGQIPCEDKIKADSAREEQDDPTVASMGAKSLCIPFEQPKGVAVETLKCVHKDCENQAIKFTLFGRSY